MASRDFLHQVVLITGAAHGAHLPVRAPYFAARREGALRRVAREIEAGAGDGRPARRLVVGERMVADVVGEFGRIDVGFQQTPASGRARSTQTFTTLRDAGDDYLGTV